MAFGVLLGVVAVHPLECETHCTISTGFVSMANVKQGHLVSFGCPFSGAAGRSTSASVDPAAAH